MLFSGESNIIITTGRFKQSFDGSGGEDLIPKQIFGRSGHLSSRILLGAAAFSDVTQDEADQAMELAFSYGVNHVDVAAGYGDAELRVGSWIKRHGRPFFLATKTGQRTKDKARDEIHRSLERLQVDQVDLMQLHFLVDPTGMEYCLRSGWRFRSCHRSKRTGSGTFYRYYRPRVDGSQTCTLKHLNASILTRYYCLLAT